MSECHFGVSPVNYPDPDTSEQSRIKWVGNVKKKKMKRHNLRKFNRNRVIKSLLKQSHPIILSISDCFTLPELQGSRDQQREDPNRLARLPKSTIRRPCWIL